MSGAIPLLPLYAFMAWARTSPFLHPDLLEDEAKYWSLFSDGLR